MIDRIGDFALKWGESLLWDERRERLYFADTLGHAIHWLDHEREPLHTIACPTMPSGMVNDEMGHIVVTGDDGLYRVDVDRNEWSFLTAYPND